MTIALFRNTQQLILYAAARDDVTRGVSAAELAQYLDVGVERASRLLAHAAKHGIVYAEVDDAMLNRGVIYRTPRSMLAAEPRGADLPYLVAKHRTARATFARRGVITMAMAVGITSGLLAVYVCCVRSVPRPVATMAVAAAASGAPAPLAAPPVAAPARQSLQPSVGRVETRTLARLEVELHDLEVRLQRLSAARAECATRPAADEGRCYVDGQLLTRSELGAEIDELRAREHDRSAELAATDRGAR